MIYVMRLNIKKILFELERLNQTQSWLAREMGVDRQWVWQIIHSDGKRSFTFKTVARIAKALKLDAKDLII